MNKGYAVVQQGGSSCEMYVHVHSTHEEAVKDKQQCWDDGSYDTGDVIEIPEKIMELPDSVLAEIWEFADAVARAAAELAVG